MRITTKGLILALKNIGAYLASYTVSGIKADPYQFGYSLLIFVLTTSLADLFLMNHWSEQDKKKKETS